LEQYCELHVSNIVNYDATNCTTVSNNSSVFLVPLFALNPCTTNWLTWSLNASRWSKNYIMTLQQYWSKK